MKIGDEVWAILDTNGELYSSRDEWPLHDTAELAEAEAAFLRQYDRHSAPYRVVRVRLVEVEDA